MKMSEVVLKTYNLSKKYKETMAVDKVSMTIKKGQIYGFIGQNGAGKTTIIRLITGLAHKTDGEIELFGQTNNLDESRESIGSLVESPAFYGNMTASENLEISRLVRGIGSKDSVDKVLELVNLKDTGKKKVKNFSLGMKQRLGIANALLGNPKFIILDEPINGLDPMSIVEIRELIKKLNNELGMTILISSHILGELSELATNYGIISHGKLIEEFTAKELREKCRQYIEIIVDDSKKATVLLEEKLGITNYEVINDNMIKVYEKLDETGKINTMLSLNNVEVKKILLKGQNLEEYFVSVVGGAINE